MSLPDSPDSHVEVRRARLEEAARLGLLMTEAISWGRLGELGPSFVTLLHRHMIRSRHCLCLVADDGGDVLGYIACTTDTKRFYREFLLRYGVLAAITMLPRFLNARHRQTLLRGLTHFPSAPKDDPPAEVISVAVRSGLRQKGVGRQLFEAVTRSLSERGISYIKVATVDPANEKGVAFYQRLGCTLLRRDRFYQDSYVDVYVYRVTDGEATTA